MTDKQFDDALCQWVKDQRMQHIRITRRMIVVEGMRRASEWDEDEELRLKFGTIGMNASNAGTVDVCGAHEVVVRAFGGEILRITVMLNARTDGYKCRPFVLLPLEPTMDRMDWMRSLIGAGGPQIHPVSAGHPFSATDVVFIPPHLLEDPFPPKYEDAIKMLSPNPEVVNTPRRSSIATINERRLSAQTISNHPITPAASPPPLYEEQPTPRDENQDNHLPPPTIEQPPNYSSPNLSASLSRHRNSLTIADRPPPVFSASRRYRHSVGDAYLDIIPEQELIVATPDLPSSSRNSTGPSTSAQNSRPSSSHPTTSSSFDRPGTSSETASRSRSTSPEENPTIQTRPSGRVSIDIPEYEVPLPGAVASLEEEDARDSPMLNVRRNSVRRPSCVTVSDLNVQTL